MDRVEIAVFDEYPKAVIHLMRVVRRGSPDYHYELQPWKDGWRVITIREERRN